MPCRPRGCPGRRSGLPLGTPSSSGGSSWDPTPAAVAANGSGPGLALGAHGYAARMRIVVTGATGNVGTSVVAALAGDPRVEEIVGLARRLPRLGFPRTRWLQADVVTADLTDIFRGADAVIH